MVVVGVGDEHRVEIAKLVERKGRAASEVCNPDPEQRVGQQARSVQLDEHRRVSDVRDCVHVVTLTRPGPRVAA